MIQKNIILAIGAGLTLKNLKVEVRKEITKIKDEKYTCVHVLLTDVEGCNKNVLLKIGKGTLRHIGNGRKCSLKGIVFAEIFTKEPRSFIIEANSGS